MKPSDFILNSDYLSIAQVSSNEYTVTVGAGTLQPGGGYTEQNFNFATSAQQGAIDRILVSKDGGRFQLGTYFQIIPATDIYGFLNIYRSSKTNLRAKLVLENYSASAASYPSMTFRIKVATFYPPNVF